PPALRVRHLPAEPDLEHRIERVLPDPGGLESRDVVLRIRGDTEVLQEDVPRGPKRKMRGRKPRIRQHILERGEGGERVHSEFDHGLTKLARTRPTRLYRFCYRILRRGGLPSCRRSRICWICPFSHSRWR